MKAQRPVLSNTVPNTPIFNAAGQLDWTWLKWFQNVAQTVNASFDQQGNFDGTLGVDTLLATRSKPLLTILKNIDDSGVVLALGIDFARDYVNKDTDHITDGVGSPFAGGKIAYAAMFASEPSAGQILVFDGTNWLPQSKANFKFNEQVGQVLGVFTLAHVPINDGSGNPALALYNGSARIFPGLGNDYTISGAVITPNYAIPAGNLWADYQY